MELVSSCPGVTFRDEPDHRSMIDTHELLDINTRWAYGSLTADERRAFADYLRDDSRVRLFGPVLPWQVGWHWRVNRRVLKCIRMTAVIDLFVEDLGYDVVYLVRHPIAQALSSVRRGHLSRLDCYLGDPEFMADLGTDGLRTTVARLARSGNELELAVVDWCLANRKVLKAGPGQRWFVCSYEQLMTTPESVLPDLWRFLRLPGLEAALQRVSVPSKNSDPGHRHAISGDASTRADLVGSWRRTVGPDEASRLMDIVALFGIDLYRADTDLPVFQLSPGTPDQRLMRRPAPSPAVEVSGYVQPSSGLAPERRGQRPA